MYLFVNYFFEGKLKLATMVYFLIEIEKENIDLLPKMADKNCIQL